jgi:hypothetical protein
MATQEEVQALVAKLENIDKEVVQYKEAVEKEIAELEKKNEEKPAEQQLDLTGLTAVVGQLDTVAASLNQVKEEPPKAAPVPAAEAPAGEPGHEGAPTTDRGLSVTDESLVHQDEPSSSG